MLCHYLHGRIPPEEKSETCGSVDSDRGAAGSEREPRALHRSLPEAAGVGLLGEAHGPREDYEPQPCRPDLRTSCPLRISAIRFRF